MKITYISFSAIPSRSANSIHVMKMCQALARYGHEITLLAPDLKPYYEQGIEDSFVFYGIDPVFKIKKLFCPAIPGQTIIFALSIFVYLLKNSSQIVYGRFLYGCYISSRLGYLTIFESHSPLLQQKLQAPVLKKLVKSKNFLGMVVISQALKDIYVQDGILADEKIIIAHDAADKITSSKIIKLWPGRENFLQVGYAGHLHPGRGIDILIQLGHKFPDIDFHIIGGNKEDIFYWKSRHALQNIFFHGHVSPGQVPLYLNRCAVLAAPYQKRVEVFGGGGNTSRFMSPLKIFEYMSSGKIIIASDLPVLREVLNETNSILVPPVDIQAWGRALKEIQENKNEMAKLGMQAHKCFIENYTWDKRANKILNILPKKYSQHKKR